MIPKIDVQNLNINEQEITANDNICDMLKECLTLILFYLLQFKKEFNIRNSKIISR